MTLPIAHIFNGELGFDVRTKLNDLIDLAGGGTAPFTPGSVPFADSGGGFFVQDNANFFWDNPNNLLTSGVGLKIKGATSGIVTVNTKAAAGTWTLTLPDTAGTSGYALTTNGSGVTSWTSAGGGGGMAIGSPVTSGTNKSALFVDSGGNLAQDNANFFWDDANNDLHIGGKIYVAAYPGVFVVPTSGGNSWFESNAGNFAVTGKNNFGTGDGCMSYITTGHENCAMGSEALHLVTTGTDNFGFGAGALRYNTTGSFNTAVGTNALQLGDASDSCVGIGAGALAALGLPGGAYTSNIAIGALTFTNIRTGSYNTVIGTGAGQSIFDGNHNLIMGHVACLNTAGSGNDFNCIVGKAAGLSLTHSYGNTMLGGWFGPSASMSNVIAISLGDFTLGVAGLKADSGYSNAGWTFAGSPKAGAPAATDMPSGYFSVIDDTSGGATWLVFNKAGTIRKVQLV